MPTLTPLDSEEKVLSNDHVAKHVESKLSSRHFRNALRILETSNPAQYSEFISFALESTPELAEIHLEQVWREEPYVDLYFRDAESRVRKELYWAGDGLQIWLQILYHIWRSKDGRSIVLDEPDVFLHPDLQRRLVRVLESSGNQVIMSSHASEVATESDQSHLTWVERRLKRAKRIATSSELAELANWLGSSFNLSIARALKARVALFVEGQDMKILRIIAKRLGATNFATERGIAVTPIGGYSHWPSVESFGWLKGQFLGDDVHLALLLDRDFRTLEDASDLEEKMAESSVSAHVWRKKELESYLLVPAAIARFTGLTQNQIEEFLETALLSQSGHVRAQMNTVAISARDSGERVETTIEISNKLFDSRWSTFEGRLSSAPAKEVLRLVNIQVVTAGGQTFSARRLAETIRVSEFDAELVAFIAGLEARLL